MRRFILLLMSAWMCAGPGWAQEVNVKVPKGTQIDYSGMLKPFSYIKQNARQPAQATPATASKYNSSSKSRSTFHDAPAVHERAQSAGAELDLKPPKPVFHPATAPVTLSPGIVKVPAETATGYCLQAPANYVGTGSTTRPAVTTGLPRCQTAAPSL